MTDGLKKKYLALRVKLGELNAPGAQRALDYSYYLSQLVEVQELCETIAEDAVKEMNPAEQDKFRWFMRNLAMQNIASILAVSETVEDYDETIPPIG